MNEAEPKASKKNGEETKNSHGCFKDAGEACQCEASETDNNSK